MFSKIQKKRLVLGSLLSKVEDLLQASNLFKKRLQHRCFLWVLQSFQEQLCYSVSCFWLSYHRTVKSGWVSVLWLSPQRAFNFDQNFTQNVAQTILYYHVTNCLYWLITGFRMCFVTCLKFWWKAYRKCSTKELEHKQEQHLRKSLVICVAQLVGGFLLKELEYFEVMLKLFELSWIVENVESWLVYANKRFWIT